MKAKIIGLFKEGMGRLEYALRGLRYPSDELIVLCMHSTPADRMLDFVQQVQWITKHFKPLHPNQLDAYFRRELQEGPYVLFTFDDGLKNNRHAAQSLESLQIRACFFVVPAFIQAEDSETYYRTHIRRHIDEAIDHETEDRTAMRLDELKQLIQRGHVIDSHTYSHLLRAGDDASARHREIVESGSWLREHLGVAVNGFCSPIDTSISVDEHSKKMIAANYRYHFTTFPGRNALGKEPQLIHRRNIEVHWTKGQIMYALGGWDLSRWQKRISLFRSLGS